ncbi:nitrous oxide reductase accessory protein NosL [Duganella violaceipulchra]|uniref:Uncharacterized protein n=1 Tax=Duganella violaceipulchra TaxID=2849652 RepID=A0ABT1GFM9_9BURK|nr:nitrous oxide reductase accessory protein NosL [Duganella violaceicalia]MCP2007740.1 hypothetical protein [Duganella violaceicalia]
MRINLNYHPACRVALALLTAVATGALWHNYGPADAISWAPPPDARCDAPPPLAGYPGREIAGQIRYDSGLVLRFCSLDAMFAQLGAMEHPGLVRNVYVRDGDGRWLAASEARYVRHTGADRRAAATLQAYAGGKASPAPGARVLDYQQLLTVCASRECYRAQ